MHVQDIARGELVEQVLAPGLARHDGLAVHPCGALAEPSLRGLGFDPVPNKVIALIIGQSVDGVTLGHVMRVPDRRRIGHLPA